MAIVALTIQDWVDSMNTAGLTKADIDTICKAAVAQADAAKHEAKLEKLKAGLQATIDALTAQQTASANSYTTQIQAAIAAAQTDINDTANRLAKAKAKL